MSVRALESRVLLNVTKAMDRLYPLKNAENSWDNTGLLVDASVQDQETAGVATTDRPNILLAVDLTEAVADEAIRNKCNIIIAYHPFLFRKFNRISPAENSQQRSLVKLIRNNVSVYSPHTAVDAAVGGVNDWLADGISRGSHETGRKVIIPDKSNVPGVGMGRIVELESAIPLTEAVARIKKALQLDYLQVASRRGVDAATVRKVAICAGSGSSVFQAIDSEEYESIDLFYTGELSHHELLALSERDKSVVLCGHCNTERGFLPTLHSRLAEELASSGAKIAVSQCDRSPFVTI